MQGSADACLAWLRKRTTDWTGGRATGGSGGESADEACVVNCDCNVGHVHAWLLSSGRVGNTVMDVGAPRKNFFRLFEEATQDPTRRITGDATGERARQSLGCGCVAARQETRDARF